MVKLRDSRWAYLAIFIVMFALCNVAIPSPIPILAWTKALYDYIDRLPAGSLVLVSNQYGSPGPTFEPFAHAFLYQLMVKHLRLVVVSPALIFVPWADRLLHETGWFDPANGKIYGVDFVNLGFLPGMEAGIATLAKDVSAVYKIDYYGTDVNSLPIMKDFKSATDAKIVVIIYDYNPEPYSWIRQWRPYGVPIALHHYGGPATWLPYWNTGDLIGVSSDIDGGAQYETLVGVPGLATALTTLSSSMFLFQAATIVAGSVFFWYQKLAKKKEVA